MSLDTLDLRDGLLRYIDPFCCITSILTAMLVWISFHFCIGYPDVICGIIIALWLFPKSEIWLWTFNNRKIDVRSSFLCLGPLMLPQAHLATTWLLPLASKERSISNLLFFVNWMQQAVNTIHSMWLFWQYILKEKESHINQVNDCSNLSVHRSRLVFLR